LERLEENDLDVRLKFAFVCEGSMRDFVKLRDYIRASGATLIYNISSASYLFILKNGELTAEQAAGFEKTKGSKR
jgi:hypothetical protein